MSANSRSGKVSQINRWELGGRPMRSRRIGNRGLTLVSFVSAHAPFQTAPSEHKERMMHKLLAMGVVTISLVSFGTCWAQSTSPPSQTPPPAKTAPAPAHASHSTSRSGVQQFKSEADAKSHCGTDQV